MDATTAALLFPGIRSIDGIWLSIIVEEGTAVLFFIIFLIAKQKSIYIESARIKRSKVFGSWNVSFFPSPVYGILGDTTGFPNIRLGFVAKNR